MSPKTRFLTLLNTSVRAFMRYFAHMRFIVQKARVLAYTCTYSYYRKIFLLLTGGAYFAPVQSTFSLHCLAATLCSGPGL